MEWGGGMNFKEYRINADVTNVSNHTHENGVCQFTGIRNMAFTPHVHKKTQSLNRRQT